MTEKFQEGQQVWICANLGGQLVREKGIVLGVSEIDDGIYAGSFASSRIKFWQTEHMSEFRLGPDGRGENVWLEPRL